MITAEQIRAARAILKWSAAELAEKAGISWDTVQRMERNDGVVQGRSANVHNITKVLEEAGIKFIDGGVVKE